MDASARGDAKDPVDLIADALARVRGPRGPFGFGGAGAAGGGGPFGPEGGFGFGGPGGPFGHHGHRGHRDRGDGPRGPRGGLALLRLIETLARAESPLTVSELAERIGVDQPRGSRLVQQAVAVDLVAREADPDDARRSLLVLTERGRLVASRFVGARRDAVAQALAGFSDAERTELARLLGKLAAAWPGR